MHSLMRLAEVVPLDTELEKAMPKSIAQVLAEHMEGLVDSGSHFPTNHV